MLFSDANGPASQSVLQVPATSVDAEIKTGERVDFAKIDVEGAEHLVLSGMLRVLTEAKPTVLIEFHNYSATQRCLALLERIGYRVSQLDGTTPFSYENGRTTQHGLAVPTSRTGDGV